MKINKTKKIPGKKQIVTNIETQAAMVLAPTPRCLFNMRAPGRTGCDRGLPVCSLLGDNYVRITVNNKTQRKPKR